MPAPGFDGLNAALEALAQGRFAEVGPACSTAAKGARPSSVASRAASALSELARRCGGPRRDAIVHVGRATLDELLGDLPLALRVRCEAAYYASTTGFVSDRVAEARGVEQLLARCRSRGVAAPALLALALAKLWYGAGDLARARAASLQGLELLKNAYDPRTEIRLRVHLGFVIAAQGESTAALDLVESQIGRAYAMGFGDELSLACSAAMYLLAGLDRFEEAARWGDYALARTETRSPAWIAVLSYNMATLDIQRGRPASALARLDALRSDPERLRVPDEPMVSVLRILALVQTDRYDEAAELLRAATGTEAPHWVRLELRNVEGLLCELRDDLPSALELATFVMRQQAPDSNARRSRLLACGAAARLRYRLGMGDMAEPLAVCEDLSQQFRQARAVRATVEAYRTLARDLSPENARALALAARSNADRFTRALDTFEAAKILADYETFAAVSSEFEAIGARGQVLRVRTEAAQRGVRVSERLARRSHLTAREAELAHHIASGKTNAEIARILRLSRKTVDNHVSNILGKCGVRSRVDVAALVIRGKLPVEPAAGR